MRTKCSLILLSTCALAIILTSCGQRIPKHPRVGQFSTTKEIWAVTDPQNSVMRIGTNPVRSLDAPEGKVFLIYYAASGLGGTYRARNWKFKAQLKNGEEITPFGTRIEAVFCPVDMLSGEVWPRGTPFTVLPQFTNVTMGGQAECLSLLFIVASEDIDGLKILREVAGSWREERILSEECRWAGPPSQQ
jgi:hypothetical protein